MNRDKDETRRRQKQLAKERMLYAREQTAELSQEVVAELMTMRGFPMTTSAVQQTEARALYKIRKALSLARDRGDV